MRIYLQGAVLLRVFVLFVTMMYAAHMVACMWAYLNIAEDPGALTDPYNATDPREPERRNWWANAP